MSSPDSTQQSTGPPKGAIAMFLLTKLACDTLDLKQPSVKNYGNKAKT